MWFLAGRPLFGGEASVLWGASRMGCYTGCSVFLV